MAVLRETIRIQTYFYRSVRDYVGCQFCEIETTARYHGKLQQPSSIDVSKRMKTFSQINGWIKIEDKRL